jgi:hypothetical protein
VHAGRPRDRGRLRARRWIDHLEDQDATGGGRPGICARNQRAADPPKLAVVPVALFALMTTMIIAARFVPLPMMNEGVVTLVTFH